VSPATGSAHRFRLIAAALLLAANASARHIPVQIFTTAQGLPRNSVTCMVPGKTGLLWLCTSEGLASFDGHRFRVFGPADGLPSRVVLDFAPSRKGGFWVVTDRGVCRLTATARIGEPCRLLKVPGTFAFSGVFESKSGETWVIANSKILHVSSDQTSLEATTFQAPPLQAIFMMEDAPAGKLLVGTEKALFEWTPGAQGVKISAAIGEIGPQQTLLLPSGVRLIAATNGLFQATPQAGGYSFRRLSIPGSIRLDAILQRRDGTIWISGTHGLIRLAIQPDGAVDIAEHLTSADGLPRGEIEILFEDDHSNLWGGSQAAGIFRLETSGFVTWSKADGLGEPRISSIFDDAFGRLLVTTSWGDRQNIKVLNGKQFGDVELRHPAAMHSFGFGWNQIVARAHDGEWWVASAEGLLRFPPTPRVESLRQTNAAAVYDARSPLGCDSVFRVFEDSRHDIWISCLAPSRQLTRWQRSTGQSRHWTVSDGWPDRAVGTVFRETAAGALWLCTGGAVVRFRNDRFEVFPLPEGPRAGIRDLLIDHAGRLWIATMTGGVFRCDRPDEQIPSFRQYSVLQGLSTNSVRSLVEDRSGFIYAGTALGVDRIDTEAPIESRRIRHFTTAEGLPDSEQNTAFRDRAGHLWFGTLDGLAEFVPTDLPRASPPDVYITRLRVRGEDLRLPWEGTRSLSLDLAPDRNQAEIEFGGIDFRPGGSLLYQYRLGAGDQPWSTPSAQQIVNYASLPAGSLHFEVRAVDDEGRGAGGASLHLRVAAPLWRRWWFLTSGVLVLLAAGSALYNFRVRNLLAMERLRVRIATDLHDDIGASLTQISILSEVARRSGAVSALTDIAEIARAVVQDMSDIVWAVNPRHDRLEDLVNRMRRFAGDTLGDIDFRFEAVNLPGERSVPLNIRRPLYLVFKEAVNNVARHSGAGDVGIRLSVQGQSLLLRVDDDGRGFSVGKAATGEGLLNIRRRMRESGGSAEWDSHPGGGTRFRALFPMNSGSYLSELMGRFTGAPR
jgi:ligand-binding sensor domain-containing protein/two-component sensor histidine kinase